MSTDKEKFEQIGKMTKASKAHYLRGTDNWRTYSDPITGLNPVVLCDGPVGVRKETSSGLLPLEKSEPAICFPSGALMACSFDREAMTIVGKILGNQTRAMGVDVILGPAINIKRSPLGGRGFEYYSEDPYLAGELALSYINGVQSQGVGVSVKHFAANSQEKGRLTINEVIDDRALHEIYLKAFEKAIRDGKPATVMTCYNKINKVHMGENRTILIDWLREKLGYEGVTLSDWGAVNDPVASFASGLDLEMPNSHDFNYKMTLAAIESSPHYEEAADKAIFHIMKLEDRPKNKIPAKINYDQDHEETRRLADDAIVLLKNDGILPLASTESLAVIGSLAKTPRYQGGGSSHINSYKVNSFLDMLTGIDAEYEEGYNLNDPNDDSLIARACDVASKKSKVLLFLGVPETMESEGYDRNDLDLPANQLKLIQEIRKVNPNIVIVLMNGGPFVMPFLKDVKGIVETYLGGEAINEAIFDILYGKVNPSGHLAETFPLALADCPCSENFPGDGFNVFYKESIYVGYRYYSTFKVPVLFPFGFGLSYTTFAITAFDVQKGQKDQYFATVTVKNTGAVAGKAVPQLYVTKPSGDIYQPALELCGFDKVLLNPGEEKTVTLPLENDLFSYYHFKAKKNVPLFGDYIFRVGFSSADITLAKTITLVGTNVPSPYIVTEIPSYYGKGIHGITDKEFERIFVGDLPTEDIHGPFSLDTSIHQAVLAGSKGAKKLLEILSHQEALTKDKGMYTVIEDGPLRQLIYFIPALGGENIHHFLSLFNDHNWHYHLIKVLLAFKKAAEEVLPPASAEKKA